MTMKPTPICAQHNTEKVWQQAVFEYSEDDISVRVEKVWAWVVLKMENLPFTPETLDALIDTVPGTH